MLFGGGHLGPNADAGGRHLDYNRGEIRMGERILQMTDRQILAEVITSEHVTRIVVPVLVLLRVTALEVEDAVLQLAIHDADRGTDISALIFRHEKVGLLVLVAKRDQLLIEPF